MREAQAKAHLAQHVSRETMEDFEKIGQALHQWSKRFNLVAPSTLDEYWSRHVLDSWQLYDLAPKQTGNLPLHWLDLGSGAGFPGMILAVLLKDCPGAQLTLIESNGKKCSFLRHCARITQAPALVCQARIEAAPAQTAGVITARALADLSKLLDLSCRFANEQTTFLFSKGKNAKQELTTARGKWDIEADLLPSITDEHAHILRFSLPKQALS
jgi:16S rRNA (guanine527-N7)-methyltransferase